MKRFIKFLYVILMFLSLPLFVNANDIEITSLESNIKLNKDRTIKVKEDYELYFSKNVKKFNRALDSSINVVESNTVIKPIISSISTLKKYEINDIDKKKIVVLNVNGKEDTIADLSLEYKYDFGKDESRKNDLFYYNIISNFDNIISDISFEIELPDKNYKKITFLLNGKEVKDDILEYSVEKNIITGYLNTMLDEEDILSIYVEFPNGYFINANDTFNYLNYFVLILPIISFIFVIIYWFKYAKGNKAKKKYSYYPPYDFDPAEIGYLYKGKTDESDLGSLVIYLANQGYMNIEEYDDGYKLGRENSFSFIKQKDYKKRNAAEKIIFNGIFKNRDMASLSDIEYTISTKLMDAKKTLDNSDNKKKLFNIDINKSKLVIMILTVLSVLFLTVVPVKEFTDSYLLVPVLTLTMVFGLAIISIIEVAKIPKFILGLVFIGGTIWLNIYSLLGQNLLMILYIIGTVFVILTTFIFKKLPLRTKFGNEKLGEVEGFRLNLVTMDLNKLKELIDENPNYYYDMVPYLMVFDQVDNWITLGSKLGLQRPSWHLSSDEFNIKKEFKFFKNVVFTSTQVMIKGLYVNPNSTQLKFKKDIIESKLNDY